MASSCLFCAVFKGITIYQSFLSEHLLHISHMACQFQNVPNRSSMLTKYDKLVIFDEPKVLNCCRY